MPLKEDDQARRQARLVQFTIDHSAEPAFWVGPDARFIYVNQAACRIWGYPREELLTMTLHEVHPGWTAQQWHDHWDLIRQESRHTHESRYRTRDGRIFPVEIRVNHVQFEGREYHCVFFRDLTEQKQREEAHNRLEAQMRDVQKLESLGVLAGGIAHDFNNLLMAILGNADLALISLSPNSPVRRYVEEIGAASKRAAELCHQMLAYSGKGSMMVARYDLTTVVGEMGQMLEAGLSKKIVLHYHFDIDIPEVMADENQIQQVVLNLVTNASESLGDKKGDITISIGVMTCDREYLSRCHLNPHLPEGPYVFLEVADTGPGMAAQIKEKIFDPFFTTKFVGRGLGLAAVLGIVRSHGGTIQVNSAPGEGTAIRILLPALEPVDADADPMASGAASWLNPKTILLIDDDANVRQVSAEMLKLMGYKVMTAPGGQLGIDLYRKHQGTIGCVILDFAMPGANGLETVDGLQGMDKNVRVILSSGYAEKEVVQSAGGRPFSAFLQKPYTLEKLRDALHRALSG